MIKIDIKKNPNWEYIKNEHCNYFIKKLEKELSDLIIEKNNYKKKGNGNTIYSLDYKQRNKIENIFGGKFIEKNNNIGIFNVINNKKVINIIAGELDETMKIFKEANLNIRFVKRIFDYKKFQTNKGWNRHHLITLLGINVCPYCNRQYITSYNENNENGVVLATSDLDHFYLQKKYPYLALSLLNLIPSCQICNSRFKLEKDFFSQPHIYPYIEGFEDDAKFQILSENINYLLSESNDFCITIEPTTENSDKEKRIKESIKTFKLDKVYNTHKDYVQEIIKKCKIYNKSKIDELWIEFNMLFDSKEEIYRIIYGNYICKEDFDKRPLAKLTRDICDYLGVDFE